MKIFILLPLDGTAPIVGSSNPVEYHLANLISGLKYMGHKVSFGQVPDRKFYDVALAIEYTPYLKLVRAGKHFTDLYTAAKAVPENDGVFFRSYYHQYLIRRHSNIELEKCFIVGQVVRGTGEQKRDADRDASDTNTPPIFTWPVDPTWGLYHVLRLWPQIKERLPRAILRVAGDPRPMLASYKLDANIRGLQSAYSLHMLTLDQKDIIWTSGSIYPERIQELPTSIFAYTYDPMVPLDMFGVQVGEALAQGTRVIVPANTALSEVWGKRGALVLPSPPLDLPNSFEDNLWLSAIEDMLEKPAPTPQGLDDYNWYNVVDRYVQAFEGNEVEFGRPGVTLIGDANSATVT